MSTVSPPAQETQKFSLEKQLKKMIEGVDLSPKQKEAIEARWLSEVMRMDHRVRADRWKFYWLRLPVVVGAAILPAIVNLKVSDDGFWGWVALVVSAVVAIGAALEGVLRFGPRWRVYRRSFDALLTEGWKFFQLIKPYDVSATHSEAYPEFAAKVEEIIGGYAADYLAGVVNLDPAGHAADGDTAGNLNRAQ